MPKTLQDILEKAESNNLRTIAKELIESDEYQEWKVNSRSTSSKFLFTFCKDFLSDQALNDMKKLVKAQSICRRLIDEKGDIQFLNMKNLRLKRKASIRDKKYKEGFEHLLEAITAHYIELGSQKAKESIEAREKREKIKAEKEAQAEAEAEAKAEAEHNAMIAARQRIKAQLQQREIK